MLTSEIESAWSATRTTLRESSVPPEARLAAFKDFWKEFHPAQLPRDEVLRKVLPYIGFFGSAPFDLFGGQSVVAYAQYAKLTSEEEGQLWRTYHGIHGSCVSRPASRLVEYLGLDEFVPRASNLLDIGCGKGVAIRGFVRECNHIRGAGIDLAVQQSIGGRLSLHGGDMRHLPFTDESFDLAYSLLAFSYLSNADHCRATDEALRVLRPGGVLVVDDLRTLNTHSAGAEMRRSSSGLSYVVLRKG